MKRRNLLLVGSLLLSSTVWADRPQWSQEQFPFEQSLNLELVHEITTTPPDKLVQKMQEKGVQVLLVRTAHPTKPLNPLLANLEVASPELLKKVEFEELYDGRMMSKDEKCCDLKRDTVFIRDTAETYTLIHEFMHSALRTSNPNKDHDIEAKFDTALRTMNFYQKKLFDDPYKMMNPLWRKDILARNQELVGMLYHRLQIGQSQEAIIEKTLKRYIDEKNPYFNKARQEQGIKYGEAMINNIIDVYNAVEYSISWGKNTVAGLRASLEQGDIPKSEEKNLTAKLAQEHKAAAEKLIEQMKPVKEEILKMKAFYTKQP